MMPSAAVGAPGITFSRLTLPRLSVTEAQAYGLIARHGSTMVLTLPWPAQTLLASDLDHAEDASDGSAESVDGDGTKWHLGLTPRYAPALYDACDVRRDLDWAGARLRLHLTGSSVLAWVAASLPEASVNDLEEPLLSAAVEVLLEQVFDMLDTHKESGRLHIRGELTSDDPLPHAWTLAARNEATGTVAYGVLEADTLGLMQLANVLKRAPRTDNGIHDDSLPVTVYADLGHTTVRANELRGLRPQDTIFIDHYRVMPEGDLWLVAGGHGLRVRAMADSYCVTQGWTSLMNETSEFPTDPFETEYGLDDDSVEAGSTAGFDVDAVPVRLTFSVGERQLTLGELRELKPGETFDLSRPLASGPVIVRANGALFGTGDLVEIDGRIGVTLRTVGEPES